MYRFSPRLSEIHNTLLSGIGCGLRKKANFCPQEWENFEFLPFKCLRKQKQFLNSLEDASDTCTNFKNLKQFIEITYFGPHQKMWELNPPPKRFLCSRQKITFRPIWSSWYCSSVCGQIFFCLKRHANEAKAAFSPRLYVKPLITAITNTGTCPCPEVLPVLLLIFYRGSFLFQLTYYDKRKLFWRPYYNCWKILILWSCVDNAFHMGIASCFSVMWRHKIQDGGVLKIKWLKIVWNLFANAFFPLFSYTNFQSRLCFQYI